MALRVASVRLVARDNASVDEWWADVEAAVRPAAAAGADLVCLPEYVCFGLLGTVRDRSFGSERDAYDAAFTPHRDAFAERAAALARELGIWLAAGTFWSGRNEAFVLGPSGESLVQPKLHPVPDEAAAGMETGESIQTIAIGELTCGVAICYDAEFPEVPRAFARRGADLLLVPSFTSSPRGAGRVAVCARARAVENQLFCVVTPLAGRAGVGTPSEAGGFGDPFVCGPIDDLFPEPTGTLAHAGPGAPFCLAELDAFRLSRSRARGEVPPWRDRRPDLYTRLGG
jgi:predicted amidohydrolase